MQHRAGVGLKLRKRDIGGTTGCEIMARHGFSVLNHSEQLPVTFAFHHHVEVPAKCPDRAQCHFRPAIGQARGATKARETAGTQAEESLGENPAIQCALGGKVALVALGPRLDGVRDVVS